MAAPFPGDRRAAVCLTYDDALPQHRLAVAPELERHGIRGTFFAPAASEDLLTQAAGWRALAERGHELANHSVFHPCRKRPGAEWPDDAYDYRTYSHRRAVDEFVLADRVLHLIDGRVRRALCPGCGHLTTGPDGAERSFLDDLRPLATVVRLGGGISPLPLEPAPFTVPSALGDGRRADDLIALLEPMLDRGGWLPVMMHGVGPEQHGLFIAADEHRRLCAWIAAHADRLWAAPLTEVVDALRR